MNPLNAACQKSFFQTLHADFRAFIKGEASSEQKERLTKQAGVTILVGSALLLCFAVWGAHKDGEELPISFGQLASLTKEGAGFVGGGGVADAPPLVATPSTRDLFDQPTPSPFSQLREDPDWRPLPRLKNIQGPRRRRLPSSSRITVPTVSSNFTDPH